MITPSLNKGNNVLSTENKINIIFEYLFGGKKAEEEEFFWNELNKKEIRKLGSIKNEKKTDFKLLQKKFLGK